MLLQDFSTVGDLDLDTAITFLDDDGESFGSVVSVASMPSPGCLSIESKEIKQELLYRKKVKIS